MSHRVLGGALGLLAAVLAFGSGGAAGPRKAETASPWLTDYARGREEAARTGKPMLVVFRCPH
jgi:hypothetical protein